MQLNYYQVYRKSFWILGY